VTTTSAHPPRRKRNWFLYILGWIFLVLGVAGLVLPFLQGILFIVIGFALLSRETEWGRRLKIRFLDRYPDLKPKVRRTEAYTRVVLRRWTRPFRKNRR
jgi:uncharacterized protein